MSEETGEPRPMTHEERERWNEMVCSYAEQRNLLKKAEKELGSIRPEVLWTTYVTVDGMKVPEQQFTLYTNKDIAVKALLVRENIAKLLFTDSESGSEVVVTLKPVRLVDVG